MNKRKVIVSVNLEFDIPDDIITEEETNDYICDVDLPDNYVEDSFEIVKVME